MSSKIFPDGSLLEWKDRESLRYTEGAYYVLIWVDFGRGFFSRARVLPRSSIELWSKVPDGVDVIHWCAAVI